MKILPYYLLVLSLCLSRAMHAPINFTQYAPTNPLWSSFIVDKRIILVTTLLLLGSLWYFTKKPKTLSSLLIQPFPSPKNKIERVRDLRRTQFNTFLKEHSEITKTIDNYLLSINQSTLTERQEEIYRILIEGDKPTIDTLKNWLLQFKFLFGNSSKTLEDFAEELVKLIPYETPQAPEAETEREALDS